MGVLVNVYIRMINRGENMQKTALPKTYKGYKTEGLLQILEEIRNKPGGTSATQEAIKAMRMLIREYKLTPVHHLQLISKQ